jgi:VanZ family protein
MFKRLSPVKWKRLCQVALVCFWVFMLIGTHLPPTSPFLPNEAHNLDKVFHASSYAVLAALLATTWELSAGKLNAGHLLWVWIAVVIWAAIDELSQTAFNRDCSFWDWSADATGAAVGLLAFVWIRKMLSDGTESRSSNRLE